MAPAGVYVYLMRVRRVARLSVLAFGLFLVLLSAIDLVLLRYISVLARASTSLLDDQLFLSELTVALHLLPLLSAGIGINMVSQILPEHLRQAERNYDDLHR